MSTTKNWNTEALVLFGLWLIKNGERGYGLLCIHGSILGLKIGELLKLKWEDFIITEGIEAGESREFLEFNDERLEKKEQGYRELNEFIRSFTHNQYHTFFEENKYYPDKDFIYCKSNSKKVFTTSTLNRELQKFQSEFKKEIFSKTTLNFNFKELKTNAFEIAWALDMVRSYSYSKKVFIAVSKYMGHRTLKHTIDILGVEPDDEIVLNFNHYNPSSANKEKLYHVLNNPRNMYVFLLNNNMAETSTDDLENTDRILFS